MPRPTVRRTLVCALAGAVALVAQPLLGGAATAALAGVFSAQWQAADDAGAFVDTAAQVTTTVGGGAKFQRAYARYVILTPPTGGQFTAGTDYSAGARSATVAGFSQFGFDTCQAGWTGTIHVDSASYDGTGTLTSLAARYDAICHWSSTRTDHVDGEVRLADDTPYVGLVPTYAAQTVAIGKSRSTTLTVAATGAGQATLGAATVKGAFAGDYTVTDNGCDGRTLTGGQSCVVTVAFAPQPTGTGMTNRAARLELATPGHLGGTLSASLTGTSVTFPDAPRTLTTFPVPDGVGLSWHNGMSGAAQYDVERRWSDADPWTPIATVDGNGPLLYVDHDVTPGEAVQYRVAGDNSSWVGDFASTATVREDSDPVAGGASALAVGATAPDGPSDIYRSSDPDTTVTAGTNEVYASRTTSTTSEEEAFRAPAVPGPGVYRQASGLSGSIDYGSTSQVNCSYTDSVLRVRSVLFDDSGKPLVYDASWTGWCADGTEARAEIRLGVDGDVALTTGTPVSLTTYAGTPVSRTVTVANRGPGPVDVGAAAVAGDAAGDWSVADNSCSGSELAAGASCTFTATFATTAAGTRDARVELEISDGTGPLAPHVVLLHGRGATPPSAISYWYGANGLLTGVRTWWLAPYDDGGYPVDHYDLRRRATGATGDWTSLGSTTDLTAYDRTVPGNGSYDYQVRAVNRVGAGPWATASASLATAGVVVDGETTSGAPRALYLLSGDNEYPAAVAMTGPVTYDHEDPAVSPGGGELVYARSTNPGTGADGEYDLWLSSVGQTFGATPAVATQLTALPGAERDPAVSPDGATVAFTHVSATDGSRSVWLVPTRGGGSPTLLLAGAANPAWTADGAAVVVEDTSGGQLKEVPVAGGDPEPVAGTVGGTDPAVSRTGTIAFIDEFGNLDELTPSSPDPNRHVVGSSTYSDPAYTADGHLLVTETSGQGTSGIEDLTAQHWLYGGLEHVTAAAAAIRDVHAPTVQIDHVDAAVVRGSQQVTFDYADDTDWPGTPRSGLRVDCRLDSAAWGPCTSPVTFSGLPDGGHKVAVRVRDEAGNQATASTSFVSDTTPPTLAITAPGSDAVLAGDGDATFGWKGQDPDSRVVSYDIAWRTARAGHAFSGWHSLSQSSDRQSRVHVDPGEEACLRVRSRNAAGYPSPWVTRCVGRPYDDGLLAASPQWRSVTTGAGWELGLTEASSADATLTTRDTVIARRLEVLAQTCSGCGAVRVYVGSRYVGKVSLASPATRSKVLVPLPPLSSTVTGKVRLVSTSRAQVRVDGLLVLRT